LPGKFTRQKHAGGYTTDNGIHKHLLVSFLEMASCPNSQIKALYEDDHIQAIPIAAQKDGMALKPGLHVDTKRGIIVGTTETIDVKFVNEHLHPPKDYLKNIFVKEAEYLRNHNIVKWLINANWC
jgi:hypothetical protein